MKIIGTNERNGTKTALETKPNGIVSGRSYRRALRELCGAQDLDCPCHNRDVWVAEDRTFGYFNPLSTKPDTYIYICEGRLDPMTTNPHNGKAVWQMPRAEYVEHETFEGLRFKDLDLDRLTDDAGFTVRVECFTLQQYIQIYPDNPRQSWTDDELAALIEALARQSFLPLTGLIAPDFSDLKLPRSKGIKVGGAWCNRRHLLAVEKALEQNLPVPPEVLKDYPWLKEYRCRSAAQSA